MYIHIYLCQYLHFCTSKASKVGVPKCSHAVSVQHPLASSSTDEKKKKVFPRRFSTVSCERSSSTDKKKKAESRRSFCVSICTSKACTFVPVKQVKRVPESLRPAPWDSGPRKRPKTRGKRPCSSPESCPAGAPQQQPIYICMCIWMYM